MPDHPAVGVKIALICGISGQDGAYLAQSLLDKGNQVSGTAGDTPIPPFANLQHLGTRERVILLAVTLSRGAQPG